jgi:hypothetical protein
MASAKPLAKAQACTYFPPAAKRAAVRAGVAQLVRALVCGTRGRWFKSTRLYHLPFRASRFDPVGACIQSNKNAGENLAGVL